MSKEKSDEYWEGYIQKQNESMEICKICRYRTEFRELEKQVEDSILTSVIREEKEELEIRFKDVTQPSRYSRYTISECIAILEVLERILKKGEK